ncbi:MAG TPA: hypothetical protein PLY34_03755 [Ferruginibacter sp.]|nr:hypothetical protein [Ferruginibacter sp.]HPH89681.1 hypothetical protein [Ferruginibacter sp.]
MERFIKKAAIILALVSVTTVVFADRGTGKKSNKARTTLNITPTASSLKSTVMSNLKNGLSYKGSFLTTKHTTSAVITSNTMMTYQKGNTTYLLPYKSKMAVADMGQGYTGVKLIIRSKK